MIIGVPFERLFCICYTTLFYIENSAWLQFATMFELRLVERLRSYRPTWRYPYTIGATFATTFVLCTNGADAVVATTNPRRLHCNLFAFAVPKHLVHTSPAVTSAVVVAILNVDNAIGYYIVVECSYCPTVVRANIGVRVLGCASQKYIRAICSTSV